MEFCQYCGQYMKPLFNKEDKTASCEFCGKVIARWTPTKEDGELGRWAKTLVN
jgi:DNA-directed RNA polymerase subunit M/transcription elongation factor TFIIS